MISELEIFEDIQSRERTEKKKGQGREDFRRFFHREILGITEDAIGNPCLAESRTRPEEISLRDLGNATMGDRWIKENLDPRNRGFITESAIDPTAILNASFFASLTAGMVSAKILEGYKNPAFIGDELVATEPTRMNGEKIAGLNGIATTGESRKPGQPHARTGFSDSYIETPVLDEKALAIEILQETVFYDRTGDVLRQALGIGEALGYGREETILRLVMGFTNPYKYNGTSYNTYQTATPWINSHTNVFADHTDVNNADQLFVNMLDPVTGRPILIMPNMILHMPSRDNDFNRVLSASEVRETTNTNTVTISGNPLANKTTKNHKSSPIAFAIATASAANNGLALTASAANDRWWYGDFKKAFKWMEAWPLRVLQARTDEKDMIDRGIIASYFANYRGEGAVFDPRYVVENKQ